MSGMRLTRLLWGLAAAGLGCGNASSVSPEVDAAAHTAAAPAVDAHAADVGVPVDGKLATHDAATADRPPAAPTWSTIYSQLLVNPGYASNCTGSACHDPGTEKGIDLSTPDMGYTTILHRITPGKPSTSELITVLQSGFMPQGRPHMPAADVAQVSAWIESGAQNN